MRAIFLDKDGTLVEDVPYNVDLELIVLCPHVVEGLCLLRKLGYALFIVSNQTGIAAGKFSEQDVRHMLHHLCRMLAQQGATLDGFYYCPHHPAGTVATYANPCTCRKPMPGMLQRAAQEHGIDLHRSWMIGDILDDIEAGRRAGCKTVLIDSGNETQWQRSPLRTPHIFASDMAAAAKAIASIDNIPSTNTQNHAKDE